MGGRGVLHPIDLGVTMREGVTTVLEAIALLAIAAGVGAGAAQWIGWFGMAVGGVVLVGLMWMVSRR